MQDDPDLTTLLKLPSVHDEAEDVVAPNIAELNRASAYRVILRSHNRLPDGACAHDAMQRRIADGEGGEAHLFVLYAPRAQQIAPEMSKRRLCYLQGAPSAAAAHAWREPPVAIPILRALVLLARV